MSEQPQQEPRQNFNISDDASLENVQIGGIAGRDLNVTQISGQVVYANVYDRIYTPDGLSTQPINPIKPLTRNEYRQRKVLLNKVKNFWIENYLKKSLHNQVLFELGIKEKSDAIQTRFPGVEEFSEQSEQNNSKGTNITEVFQQMGMGQTLLILGEPGSGKTITLLKLAQSLIKRTEKDFSQPIPVVFNLSSWTIKQQAIDEWLIEQLFDRYEVDKSFGETWIREQQLILFLDGLDEVKAEFRNDCVRELNKFTKSHGITEIVICCRIQDYEALEEQLTLQSAICIQVLNQSQIYQYLDRAGEQLLALKTLLQKDAELLAFATSPLILSVMSLAYQGCSSEELSFLVSAGEWKQRLFDKYIERMFQRHSQTQLYPQKQTQRYLIWLAQRMAQESQTVFLIDQMQPNLLKGKYERRIYKVVSFLISIFTTRFNLEIRPIEISTKNNSIMGLRDFYMLSSSRQTSLKILHYRYILMFLLMALNMFLQHNEIVSEAVRDFYSPIALLILILVEINYFYIIIKKRKTLKNITRMNRERLLNKKNNKQTPSQYPNEKIFKSAKKSMGGFLTMLITFPLLFLLLKCTTPHTVFITYFYIALLIFVYGTLMIILVCGGQACIQHFTIRLILYRNSYIPWNYARFLNYATKRIFLQKIGGGYIFVHRMLLEHFAKMELE
ncbi:MAG: NACHT domain-containing protein [Cyanobacteria bacterium J06643_5]